MHNIARAGKAAYLDGAVIERLLPMGEAIAVLEQAWRSGAAADEIPRAASSIVGGHLLSMPAASPSAIGVKVVTVASGQPRAGPRVNGAYVLFGPDLRLRAILDAAALTSLRTPAVSAVAADALAMPGAQVLVVFGTGVQARGHVTAMRAIRPISRVHVVGRRQEAARALADQFRHEHLNAGAAAPDAVAEADIICTCTTSPDPLFDGRLIPPTAHVSAIGSFQPGLREVDDYTASHSAIVVETRAAALAEAGDILIPLRYGIINAGSIVADLSELIQGKVTVDKAQRTLFKSVGIGFEDLVIATEIVRRLEA